LTLFVPASGREWRATGVAVMGRWLSDLMVAIPPAGAYLVVAVVATAESLFLGLVLPGELVLILAGLLAFHGRVSLTVMLVLAAVGSVGGYLLAYQLGRRYGPAGRRPTRERDGDIGNHRAGHGLDILGGHVTLLTRRRTAAPRCRVPPDRCRSS